jgi:hypothetical protein
MIDIHGEDFYYWCLQTYQEEGIKVPYDEWLTEAKEKELEHEFITAQIMQEVWLGN